MLGSTNNILGRPMLLCRELSQRLSPRTRGHLDANKAIFPDGTRQRCTLDDEELLRS